MRTFQIKNADGQTWDLTAIDRTFFYNVEGLGFERITEYMQIGSRFEPALDALAQQDIVGSVKFSREGSAHTYFDFIKFISDKPLILEYNSGVGVHYRVGSVVAVEKTDSAEGALRAVVTFRCRTPWIRDIKVYNNSDTQEGKIYNYRYNYKYAEFAKQTVSFESDTYLPSPVKLTIYGLAVNPTWRHYVNNKLVATGGVNATIEEGRILVVDNTRMPYTIEQFDAYGRLVSDLYQMSDFSTKRFIEIQHGLNVITVAGDSADRLRLEVEAQLEYASV